MRIRVSDIVHFFYPMKTTVDKKRLEEGNKVHRIIESSPKFSECLKEKVFEKRYQYIIVVGKPDIICPSKIIEIKHVKFLNQLIRKRAFIQIQLYMWLTNIEKGEILYVFDNEGLEYNSESVSYLGDNYIFSLLDTYLASSLLFLVVKNEKD